MSHQHINRYLILSELNRGGMAVVYHAHDPNFGRDVAVKVLPREFLHDRTFRARFQREAQAVARLEHAAIVPVYDFGEENDQMYLVMRYMPGGSLADRLAEGPLSLAEAARIVGRLAPALDRVHSAGIVHRDLKSANILFDADGEAYMTDFGIARLAATAALTASNVIVGTPAYMSPEQARDSSEIDGRADIYALGVIVFQILTGKLPYQSNSPVGYLTAHATEPIPNILGFNPHLPPVCQKITRRAMAKRPDDRYRLASDLAADLKLAAQADDSEETLRVSPPNLGMSAEPAEGSTQPTPPIRTRSQGKPLFVPPVRKPRRSPRRWGVIGVGLAGALLALGIVGVVLAELGVFEGYSVVETMATPASFATLQAGQTAAAHTPTSPSGIATPTITPISYPTANLPVVPLSQAGPWLVFLASGDVPELRYLWAVNADGTGLTRLTTEPVLIYAVQPVDTLEHGVKIAYVTRSSREAADHTLKMITLPGGATETITPLVAATRKIDAYNLTYSVEDGGLSWSPDGNVLAFVGVLEGTSVDAYTYQPSNKEITRLTDGPTHAYDLNWSPDGRYVINKGFDFIGMGGTSTVGMWAARADGTGTVPLLEASEGGLTPYSGDVSNYGWSSPTNFLFGCQYNMYSEREGSIRSADIETGEIQSILAENYDSAAFAPEHNTWLIARYNHVLEMPLILIRDGVRTEIPGKRIVRVWRERAIDSFFGETEYGKPYTISPQGDISEIPWDSGPQNTGGATSIEVSPDGTLWAWRFSDPALGEELWIGQPMAAPTLFPLPEDVAIRNVAWSPDSQRLLMITTRGLWMAARPDFAPIHIAEDPYAIDWLGWAAVWVP